MSTAFPAGVCIRASPATPRGARNPLAAGGTGVKCPRPSPFSHKPLPASAGGVFGSVLSMLPATIRSRFPSPSTSWAMIPRIGASCASLGNGRYTSVPLPNLAQLAPIRGIIAHDVDGDGNLDLIVAGNMDNTEPNTPPADAGNGLWLKGDGRGHFTPVPPAASGFLAPRGVAGLALMQTPAGKAVLIANSGDSLQAFTIKRR